MTRDTIFAYAQAAIQRLLVRGSTFVHSSDVLTSVKTMAEDAEVEITVEVMPAGKFFVTLS